jgi:hypothetical protein
VPAQADEGAVCRSDTFHHCGSSPDRERLGRHPARRQLSAAAACRAPRAEHLPAPLPVEVRVPPLSRIIGPLYRSPDCG